MKAKAIISAGIVIGLLGASAPLYACPHGNQSSAYNNGAYYGSTDSSSGGSGVALYGQSSGDYGPPPTEAPPPVDRATHLVGMKVRNADHQTLGTVTDVVFDIQSGRISYVVVKKEGRHGNSGDYAAIPPSAFTPSQDMKHLILNADKQRFENSQGFSRNNYPPLGEPAFGAQPGVGSQPAQQQILIVPIPVPQNQDENQNQQNMPDQNNDQDQSTSPPHTTPDQTPVSPQ
jgi:sporulation protein YlmC with PRC-barrel domain